MPKVCAFVREDGICMEPPRGWRNHYARLLAEAIEKGIRDSGSTMIATEACVARR